MQEAHAPLDACTQAAGVDNLITALRPLIRDFIASADQSRSNASAAPNYPDKAAYQWTAFDHPEPAVLRRRLNLELPARSQGDAGVIALVDRIFQNSANTWHQGFLDKLYGSTDSVGVVSELALAVLNTNVHVYKVAPALTVIEKTVTRALADQYGFVSPHAGGISQSGGSGANLTALVVARNCLFPETKANGCCDKRLVMFTSAHGHYSFEKAANICGLGAKSVKAVPVDARGRMRIPDLVRMIHESRKIGEMPFFVNATAGTTVLGSYDPLVDIGEVCQRERLWFHVDGSWGGSVIFSSAQRPKLRGVEKANSLAVNPHKMLGVPITCSFLLTNDLRQFHTANTLPAAYLFHTPEGASAMSSEDSTASETWDLADMTLQCGRKGDALKMALAWVWHGACGFSDRIDHAFGVAQHLANLAAENRDIVLASSNPPPCLQVCFYFARGGLLGPEKDNSAQTRHIAHALLQREFLVDYAPGEHGLFFRVVVSLNTTYEAVEQLIMAIVESGSAHMERASTGP